MDFKVTLFGLFFGILIAHNPVTAKDYTIALPPITQPKALNASTKGQAIKVAEGVKLDLSNRDFHPFWSHVNNRRVLQIEIIPQGRFFTVGFDNLFIPPNSRLSITDKKSGTIIYTFTEADNKPHRQLWTSSVFSAHALIRFDVDDRYKNQASIQIKQISQGYYDEIQVQSRAKSGSCNRDVACAEGDYWQDEIRSVAKYLITSGQSTYSCTGQILNNVRQNYVPYFLTAAHCLVSESTAPSMVFHWNFQKKFCESDDQSDRLVIQNGASFRASWSGLSSSVDGSDMALVVLDTVPDSDANVFFSGWDKRAVAPDSAVAIHQPSGDEKSISFDYNPLTVTDYASNTEDGSNTAHFLRVGAWDTGTTEPGSSGSGIWNEDRLLVGTLSGGLAACSRAINNEDNDQPDWYGRFSSHWEGNGTASGQLKPWLDPDEQNVERLKGLNRCQPPLVHINANAQKIGLNQNLQLSADIQSNHSITQYHWDVDHDGESDYQTASIDHAYTSNFTGNITLSVTDTNGCVGFGTRTIVASDDPSLTTPPKVTGDMNPLAIEAGQMINLDASTAFLDGSGLTYALYGAPAGVTINAASGLISGLLTSTDARLSPFTLNVIASNGTHSEKIGINLAVQSHSGSNLAPEIITPLADLAVGEGDSVQLNFNEHFNDPDGSFMLFNIEGMPSHFNLSEEGILSGTIKSTDVSTGDYSIVVSASDGIDSVSDSFILSARTQTSVTPGEVPGLDDGSEPATGSSSGGALAYVLMLLLARRNKKQVSNRK